jgi:hypothetical protein
MVKRLWSSGAKRICGATLYIPDDHAEAITTMECKLEYGHAGLHQEECVAKNGGIVIVSWEIDERWQDE